MTRFVGSHDFTIAFLKAAGIPNPENVRSSTFTDGVGQIPTITIECYLTVDGIRTDELVTQRFVLQDDQP